MKNLIKLAAIATAILAIGSCSKYKYETFKGDPMDTKIYTLDNGLKVYMTVNKETPRIQTYIAFRVGGKNDPADNTGLAHYLEHIMFKGTQVVGTSDFEAEKPLLDEIQALYDIYRTKTDPAEREAIYHKIDSISYEASKISIPNEYDKLMSIIGAEGSNAFTSEDVTCYTENIPSNQVENWARVQSDRFKNMVVRGFHTELEAVYEEKNRGLNNDGEKALDASAAVLYPGHPYGTQTVIGTQDHLKNPSITAIINQKNIYYVPNNCAICVSGDFDPDEFVGIIEKYFSDWEPNPDVPVLDPPSSPYLQAPVELDVYGTEAEFVMLSWRYPGAYSPDFEVADVVMSVLYNGMAGLFDLDLNQQQKVLGAYGFNYDRADQGQIIIEGLPQQGQTLQQVRDLLLEEIAKVRSGDFDESLVSSSVANIKLDAMRELENNSRRAMKFVNSFIQRNDWSYEAGKIDRLEKLTKDDVVAWACKYLTDESYALVYKHLGEDKNIYKIDAPKITPIVTNRDKESEFLASVRDSKVKPIEPVFTDFSKEMSIESRGGVEILYKKNEINDIARLNFQYDKGLLDDQTLGFAFSYLGYLGTPTRSAEEIASQMYALACEWNAYSSDNKTTISITGLDENIGKALDIIEDLVANAIADEDVLQGLKADELKAREDSKYNQRACQRAFSTYLRFGPEYIAATRMTSSRLQSLTSEELLSKVREFSSFAHKVLYYGPSSEKDFKSTLDEHHHVDGELQPLELKHAPRRSVTSPEVIVAQYDARQFNYTQYSNRGEKLDITQDADIDLFNEYFGGGMNTIVFQEMRESRALAYSAGAYLYSPSYDGDVYTFTASIGSQNDKLEKSVTAFDEIINDMPKSEKAFGIAKTALDAQLRTRRTTGMNVLTKYLSYRELGVPEDREQLEFEALGALTLDDLEATHEKWIKGRTYCYGILGDTGDLDMKFLSTLGPVRKVSLDEVYGY